MRIDDYPAQEPLSGFALRYHEQAVSRSMGIDGLEYAYGDDVHQRLLVFPSDAQNISGQNASADVLVFFHGGGWTNGYKEWMAFMAPALTAAGVTFISAGYRLAPRHVFPAGYDDALAAVSWVHGNIAEHGGDPARIFVGGHSAGGHYAALMAVRPGWQSTYGLPGDVITGALPISGTYYFTDGSGLSMRPRFLGPEHSGNDETASPMRYIGARSSPVLIAHGDQDFPHLMRQAEEFEAAMKQAGRDAERLVLPGCNHGTASFAASDADGPWVGPAVDWMRRH